MIGDSENDILCANALNIPSIVVSFGYSKVPVKNLNASIIMNNYKDLINHIQEINNIQKIKKPKVRKSNFGSAVHLLLFLGGNKIKQTTIRFRANL